MTPHISAKKEDIAKVVLMPGDPLRAKFVAEHYLTDAKLVTQVRNMLGYTGFYKGTRVTVMAHGMGIPSIGIYSHELFHFYEVDTIIRIGSAGGYTKEADVGAVLVIDKAYSTSLFAEDIGVKVLDQHLSATKRTLDLCVATAKEQNIKILEGNIFSSDVFYDATPWEVRAKAFPNLLGTEMEAFALYANAIRNHKQALCLLTVSDSYVSGKTMTPMERQTSLTNMITLGLETAIKIGK